MPLKRHVAGVAVGFVSDGDKSSFLLDLKGIEDSLGDMDLKVAGTRAGLNAVQYDTKLPGGMSHEQLLEGIALVSDVSRWMRVLVDE